MSKRSKCSTPSDPKRPRPSPPQEQQDDDPPPWPYPRLQAARFPPEIRALPHVLKQVDTFLMTDDQAVMEAARTGGVEWLRGLVEDVNDEVVTDALVEASGHGHAKCVEVLMDEYALEEERLPYICWKRALNAIEAAATNGHLEVVKVLLCRVYPGSDTSRQAQLYGTVRHALSLAAEGGHLDLVKLTVQHAICSNDDRRVYGSSALARAISAGKKVVVEYLLGVAELSWDLDNALVAAVDVDDIPLADRMYKLCVKTHEKEKLFTSLACCGKLKALKYLYQTGHRDPDLISETFVEASERTYRGTGVLDFLLSTGLVSSEAFDKGFQRAVAFCLDDVNVIAHLLDKKRASPLSINKAFVAARTCAVVNFLLDHKDIREESIRAAFERAMRSLSEFYPRGKEEEEDVQIIKLLYAKDCIPAKIIGEAVVIAATKGHSELVTLLRRDGRVSARMVGEAFAGAATRAESGMMVSLYDTDISPDALFIAFTSAIARKRICNVDELAKLLSDEDRVPQELKHKAFLLAAQLGYETALETFCETGSNYWPLAILKEALAVAKRDEVKNVIRKVICDHLFDPKCPWSREDGGNQLM